MSATATTDPADRVAGETLITLKEAAKLYPSAKGNALHVGTVRRWSERGIAGGRVKLVTVKVGGTVYTSREELGRFRRAIAAAKSRATERLDVPTARQSQRAYERAKAANDLRFGKKR